MKNIKIWNDSPSDKQVREIADSFREGEIVILPTDSVYALACDALNPKAINELCRIKGLNPEKNELSIICADMSMAAEYAVIDNPGYKLLKDYTPGAFTMIFKAARTLPKAFKGRKAVGIRIPDNLTAREVAKELGHPILCTSIEFNDDDHAREPELIAEHYEPDGIGLFVDGGDGGNEFTTVLDCSDSSNPFLIRQGKGLLD